MKLSVMIICVAGMILSSSVYAATIRVPSEQLTIQAGIDAAVDGDTVLVADGTYTGDGNRDMDFKGKAITVASENGPETCIIDCQGTEEENHRGFYFHQGETNESVVSGFTVQNGYVSKDDGSANANGGGIYCYHSSPTITNCVFSGNIADLSGGGVFLLDCSDSKLSDGEVIRFSPSSVPISNCTFTDNIAVFGGGIYSISGSQTIISNCVFYENTATNKGGGIFLYIKSHSTISNCNFLENTATNNGGGIFSSISDVTISNCAFNENTSHYGGGISFSYLDSTISNCTFSENAADSVGGGIYLDSQVTSRISNCTFTENTASTRGSAICSFRTPDSTISNCIFWNNPFDEIYFAKGNLLITYSLIRGGYRGVGNINVDPLFIGGEPFDYHLSAQSPCIDSGTDRGASPTDLDGKQRPRGGGVDMGAYEYQSWPLTVRTYVKMPSHEIFPGDVTSCSVSVWNSEYEAIEESPLFVILDIMGSYYFAPSFSSYDYFERRFPFGLTKLTILPEFSWPSNAGSVSNIVWYAFLSNHEQTELMSNIGVFDFSWSE